MTQHRIIAYHYSILRYNISNVCNTSSYYTIYANIISDITRNADKY